MNNGRPEVVPFPKPQPVLRTENLWKSYPDGRVDAVRGVEIQIGLGEYVAIMGPSGSGKSTLLNLLGALDRPTLGEIYFRGTPYSENRDLNQFRANHLGFIFQSFCLIPTLTALENVQVPMFGVVRARKERLEKARELLDVVGLSGRLHHLPTKLSVGERQRVAIARALANDPPLLLADEPTGNLDSQRTNEILHLFEKLRDERHVTLIVVTHSPDVAQRADRTLFFCDGQIMRVEQQKYPACSPTPLTTEPLLRRIA
jgi:ABC-type lipoprotein export system ATPase subunit